jgi:hypothetical protein
VAYRLSVRALASTATPGAVVLVAGKLRDGDPLHRNIHDVTNAAYRLFLAHGYDGDRIQYLATDATLDANGRGAGGGKAARRASLALAAARSGGDCARGADDHGVSSGAGVVAANDFAFFDGAVSAC